MTRTTTRRRTTRKPSAKTIERREQFAALRARLDEYAGQLTDQDRAMIFARFAGYSERNAMLIAMQCPTATEVHGYGDWQKAGRQVRKGEQGIRISAPMPPHGEQPETEQAKDGEQTEQRMRYRMASVFDITQTDPIEQETALAA